MYTLYALVVGFWQRLCDRLNPAESRPTHRRRDLRKNPGLASDRGDVPGWVLITVMTAALVVGLWALAGQAFTEFFNDSMDKVRGAG